VSTISPRPAGGDAAVSPEDDHIRKQVRGSSLLLVGRVLSLGTNLLVQMMIVRYLSKASYGAFAYALTVALLGETILLFGLDRAISRSMPIRLQKHDYPTAFGVLLLSFGTVFTLGVAVTALVVLTQGTIASSLVSDHRAVTLLAVMIALSPLQALDDLLRGVFSVMGRPRAIFFRAYVVEPGLRLAVVLILILTDAGVYFLAIGYVAAQAAGLLISVLLTVSILRSEQLLQHFRLRTIKLPVWETFAFTLPLFSTDLVNVLLFSSDALLLGHFRGTEAVGAFRVIIPAVWLNLIAHSTFTMLYIPMASRLFAGDDRDGIAKLYRQSTLWIAVISFPIFALTFSGSLPLTTALFGSRYESSAIILAILAVGYYAQGALGLNGMTLVVFGRVRDLTVLNVAAMVFNVAINLLLIPRYGAVGAAIGTSTTFVLHNVAKQIALRTGTGVSLLHATSVRSVAILAATAAAMVAVHPLVSRSVYAGLPVAALASAVVILANRRFLDLHGMFPELARVPGLRRLAGAGRPG
jgi:O-antigen/teichoic acid export membrane protein